MTKRFPEFIQLRDLWPDYRIRENRRFFLRKLNIVDFTKFMLFIAETFVHKLRPMMKFLKQSEI